MKYLVYDPRVIVLPSLDDASSSPEFFSNSLDTPTRLKTNFLLVAISNIQQKDSCQGERKICSNIQKCHTYPRIPAKIVFISTFRIEKMDLAERWKREFESSKAKLGRVRLFSIWWPAPHNLEWILSIPGVGRRRTCIVELGYDCTRMCTRRHDESTSFETLPLSLSLSMLIVAP